MTMMRFYDQQHGFYAGVDLHARRLHLCVLDSKGSVVKDATPAAPPGGIPPGHRPLPPRPGGRLRVPVRLVLAGRPLRAGEGPAGRRSRPDPAARGWTST